MIRYSLQMLLVLICCACSWAGGHWSAKNWYHNNMFTTADLPALEQRLLDKVAVAYKENDTKLISIENQMSKELIKAKQFDNKLRQAHTPSVEVMHEVH